MPDAHSAPLPALPPTRSPFPAVAVGATVEEDVASLSAPSVFSVSGWASFAASFLTAFTFSAVGEMPVGELVLAAAAACAIVSAILNGTASSPLFRVRFFWTAMAAQVVALVAYVASDLYRHSSPHDMARGWGRMLLLLVDIVGVAYLFGRTWRNVVVFLTGQALGLAVAAWVLGPMFGDVWKFGIGAPVTYLAFMLLPWVGPVATLFGALGLGAAHFLLDYRSLGGVCVIAGLLTLVQLMRPAFRMWVLPVALVTAISLTGWMYGQKPTGTRATRSGVERTAMVQAALEAFRESPLIGHGSWFSNSDVYDNFILIRHAAAREAHVGGFVGPNHEPEAIALHSQLLVAFAEGGLFGGAFFVVFGAGLIRALTSTILFEPWHRWTPLVLLVLLSALWNLLFSPFSGAHRVYIALAFGLILLLRAETETATS